MDFSLIGSAFVAGLLTFLAPCTLPLVPGYLGFISGVSIDDLKDREKAKQARFKIFLNGLAFIFGFSLVFIVLGVLAGFAGRLLANYRPLLSRIGGILVMVFGFSMLDFIKIPILNGEFHLRIGNLFRRGKFFNSFLLGAVFSLGWTPCVGPILGSILTLAATTTTIAEGAFLLLVFSLGLAIPFLAIAIGIAQASKYIGRIAKYLNFFSLLGGIFFIFLGLLLLTNSIGFLVSWAYGLFDFINYDKLLDYL